MANPIDSPDSQEDDDAAAERAHAEDALREAQAALSRAHASFRAVLDASPDMVFIYRDGTIVYSNRAAIASLGYEPDALIGSPFLDIVHAEDRAAVEERMRASAGATTSGTEIRLLRRDGCVRLVEKATLPIFFDGELATAVTAIDVTEREHTRERLLRADRLAALGTLAAGAAHEINNPLTYTMLNIEHVLRELLALAADAAPTRARVDDLIVSLSSSMDGAMRVREIVRKLTLFARGGGVEQRTLVDVHGVIESSIQMALHEVLHRARLVRSLADVPPVDANETSLGQVFLNLLVNAAQSIPEGNAATNEIRVSTSCDDAGNVVVEIADTGCGIAPDVLPKVFDPFYTSKPVGSGSGLGLSISHGSVKALGGEILVTSSPAGSTFRVVLPPAQWMLVPVPPASSPKLGGERLRVLIIDDDALVREAIARSLADECVVVLAGSGKEALDVFATDRTFDVILCDVMMSDLSGVDLYAETIRVAPALLGRFIFMTGGAFTPQAREFLESVGSQCLEKPIELTKLREVVHGHRRGAR